MDKLLKVEEVALLVGTSTKSINNWYSWKKLNPDNELTKLLPNYQQQGSRGPRYWNYEDVYKLIEFKTKIPKGRKGFMGAVTQKYYHKKEEQ